MIKGKEIAFQLIYVALPNCDLKKKSVTHDLGRGVIIIIFRHNYMLDNINKAYSDSLMSPVIIYKEFSKEFRLVESVAGAIKWGL